MRIAAGYTATTTSRVGHACDKVAQQPLVIAAIETLAIGGGAATLAYVVGHFLRRLMGE